MGRGIQNMFVIRQKITAGGAALAGRDHVLDRAVAIHDEDLIALQLVARRLENDPLTIGRPIRFSVLAAVGKLADFAEMRGRLRRKAASKQNVY